MSFGSLVPYVRSVIGPRNACETPVPGGRPTIEPAPHRELFVAEQAGALAVEDDEELLLGRRGSAAGS